MERQQKQHLWFTFIGGQFTDWKRRALETMQPSVSVGLAMFLSESGTSSEEELTKAPAQGIVQGKEDSVEEYSRAQSSDQPVLTRFWERVSNSDGELSNSDRCPCPECSENSKLDAQSVGPSTGGMNDVDKRVQRHIPCGAGTSQDVVEEGSLASSRSFHCVDRAAAHNVYAPPQPELFSQAPPSAAADGEVTVQPITTLQAVQDFMRTRGKTRWTPMNGWCAIQYWMMFDYLLKWKIAWIEKQARI